MKKIKSIIYKLLLIGFILLGIYCYIQQDEKESNQKINKKAINNQTDILEIYYLDVGEADATYIHYKNYHVLIDAGNTVDGKQLVNYLKKIGVDHFNLVFASHAHEDHIGGMQWIVYKFPIDQFYMPDHAAKWKSYQNLISTLEDKKVEKKEPNIDQIFTLDDLNIQVLWIGHNPEDYNENSIVLKLSYKNTSYLFMADAEEMVEHNLLEKEIEANVLKVGHHGSKYATTAQFLYKVNPEYAIISVGEENEYQHPHQIVLDKLNKRKVKTYRTDINHTIHLLSDGETIKINTIKTNINGGDL